MHLSLTLKAVVSEHMFPILALHAEVKQRRTKITRNLCVTIYPKEREGEREKDR